jgi:hypothetical protein
MKKNVLATSLVLFIGLIGIQNTAFADVGCPDNIILRTLIDIPFGVITTAAYVFNDTDDPNIYPSVPC